MTLKIDPFLGLGYGEDKGSDDWNIWMDTNLTKIGMSTQIGVKSATTTTPAAVVNGERWLIPTGATGVWAAHAGKLACALEGTYTYVTPSTGWRVVAEDTSVRYFHNGVQWLDEDDYGDLPALIACLYSFNSDDAAAISFGLDGAVDMTASQTGRVVIQGGSISEQRISTDSTFSTVDFTTGTKVVELYCTSTAPAIASIPGIASIGLQLIDLSGPFIRARASYVISDDGLGVLVSGNGGAFLGSAVVGTASTIGMEIDADAGTFRVIVDGTPVTLSDDTFITGNMILGLLTSESTVDQAGDVGITLTAVVRTDAADITQTYAVGATTICGDTL